MNLPNDSGETPKGAGRAGRGGGWVRALLQEYLCCCVHRVLGCVPDKHWAEKRNG